MSGLACEYYATEKTSDICIVFLSGMPTIPLFDEQLKIFNQNNIDVVKLDYYGFWRSDGNFSVPNCVKATIDLYEMLHMWCTFYDPKIDKTIFLQYKKFILIWYSFGWHIATLVATQWWSRDAIGLFSPALHLSELWNAPKEIESFSDIKRLLQSSYKYFYRNIDMDMLENYFHSTSLLSEHYKWTLSKLLDKNIFISHGSSDTIISVYHTMRFFEINWTKQKKRKLAIYDWLWHSWIFKTVSIHWFLERYTTMN